MHECFCRCWFGCICLHDSMFACMHTKLYKYTCMLAHS